MASKWDFGDYEDKTGNREYYGRLAEELDESEYCSSEPDVNGEGLIITVSGDTREEVKRNRGRVHDRLDSENRELRRKSTDIEEALSESLEYTAEMSVCLAEDGEPSDPVSAN